MHTLRKKFKKIMIVIQNEYIYKSKYHENNKPGKIFKIKARSQQSGIHLLLSRILNAPALS